MKMELIPSEFELDKMESLDEESVFRMILARVDELLEQDPDLLMSHLYRLDVDERSISNALSPFSQIPPNEAIARLILERQKKRMATKIKFKQKPIDGWEF